MTFLGSLNDDLTGHFRMDRAEVAVSAGFREREGEFLVGVEDFRFECFGIIRAHNGVRSVVAIYPGHRGSGGNGSRRWTEAEIVDLYFEALGLSRPQRSSSLLVRRSQSHDGDE